MKRKYCAANKDVSPPEKRMRSRSPMARSKSPIIFISDHVNIENLNLSSDDRNPEIEKLEREKIDLTIEIIGMIGLVDEKEKLILDQEKVILDQETTIRNQEKVILDQKTTIRNQEEIIKTLEKENLKSTEINEKLTKEAEEMQQPMIIQSQKEINEKLTKEAGEMQQAMIIQSQKEIIKKMEKEAGEMQQAIINMYGALDGKDHEIRLLKSPFLLRKMNNSRV